MGLAASVQEKMHRPTYLNCGQVNGVRGDFPLCVTIKSTVSYNYTNVCLVEAVCTIQCFEPADLFKGDFSDHTSTFYRILERSRYSIHNSCTDIVQNYDENCIFYYHKNI